MSWHCLTLLKKPSQVPSKETTWQKQAGSHLPYRTSSSNPFGFGHLKEPRPIWRSLSTQSSCQNSFQIIGSSVLKARPTRPKVSHGLGPCTSLHQADSFYRPQMDLEAKKRVSLVRGSSVKKAGAQGTDIKKGSAFEGTQAVFWSPAAFGGRRSVATHSRALTFNKCATAGTSLPSASMKALLGSRFSIPPSGRMVSRRGKGCRLHSSPPPPWLCLMLTRPLEENHLALPRRAHVSGHHSLQQLGGPNCGFHQWLHC